MYPPPNNLPHTKSTPILDQYLEWVQSQGEPFYWVNYDWYLNVYVVNYRRDMPPIHIVRDQFDSLRSHKVRYEFVELLVKRYTSLYG